MQQFFYHDENFRVSRIKVFMYRDKNFKAAETSSQKLYNFATSINIVSR